MLLIAPSRLLASAADQTLLEDLSDYVSSLKRAQARFEQFNADGTRSYGIIRLLRPRRARLDYDPPNAALIIARGQRVAVFDTKSNMPPMIYPMRITPFFHLLANDVNLGDPDHLTAVERGDGLITLTLSGGRNDRLAGVLRLAFFEDRLALAGWTFINSSGTATTLRLGDIADAPDMDPSLFDIEAEISARAG